jgi:hypothetical protein
MDFTPIGWQGPAQHTCTAACDGIHPPGPCTTMVPVRIPVSTTINGAIVALCPAEDGSVVADVCIPGPPVP